MGFLKDKLQNLGNNISNAWQNSAVGQAAINAQNQAQQVGNNISNAWQNSAVGQAAIKAQTAIQKFVDKAKDAAGNLTFAALLPFKQMMIVALRKKGFKPSSSDSIAKIAMMFHDAMILNKQSFDMQYYRQFEHLDEQTKDTIINVGATAAAGAATVAGVPIPPQTIKAVVNAVIDFIKRLQDKKAKGEQLTPEEQTYLNEAEKGVERIQNPEAAKKDWSGVIKLLAFAAGIGLLIKIASGGKVKAA